MHRPNGHNGCSPDRFDQLVGSHHWTRRLRIVDRVHIQKTTKTREAEVLIQKSLAETEKARADSEKALADARKSAAEREELNRVQLSQQPNLDVEFSEI